MMCGESRTGGTNMRGDLKWPPPEYKKQSEIDNAKRIALARGPACRPRRVQKVNFPPFPPTNSN